VRARARTALRVARIEVPMYSGADVPDCESALLVVCGCRWDA
jgi:hypothetical protein